MATIKGIVHSNLKFHKGVGSSKYCGLVSMPVERPIITRANSHTALVEGAAVDILADRNKLILGGIFFYLCKLNCGYVD